MWETILKQIDGDGEGEREREEEGVVREFDSELQASASGTSRIRQRLQRATNCYSLPPERSQFNGQNLQNRSIVIVLYTFSWDIG